MSRRRSYASSRAQLQRERARAYQAEIKANAAAQREAERARVAYEKALVAQDKEAKRLYAESRVADVAAKNEALDAHVEALAGLLAATLAVDDKIEFESLKLAPTYPAWQHANLETPEPPLEKQRYLPAPLTGSAKLFGKSKYDKAVADGEALYANHLEIYRRREEWRVATLAQARAEQQTAMSAADADAARQHAEIDEFERDFLAAQPDAIMTYFAMVLEASVYPDGFIQKFKLAYVPESRQLVCEYELPLVVVVPPVKAYRYAKTSDTITESARPATQIKSLYASVVAQTTLRTVHEIFEADDGRHVDTVVFNGVIDTTDPGTGKSIRPCLITLRTTRETFLDLDLSHVEPHACLTRLAAGVSKNPAELAPVRPVLEFDMVDARFVDEGDALSTLDTRPNLMELTPTEFETLIQNLFAKMGLDAKQTRASRDGGVDCVAYDPRPIFGGKVVIQAKRYRHTVGVSAVRDLFGTLQNEGASKGILVTTSGYGTASFDFAQNKPIELLDGGQLLYLLAEHTGIEAKIIPPDDWADPIADSPDAAEPRIDAPQIPAS
jgi:restriction system protein